MAANRAKLIKKYYELRPNATQRNGEISISGHMAGLESDDNALTAAQNAGLYLDAGPGNPQTLNVKRELERR